MTTTTAHPTDTTPATLAPLTAGDLEVLEFARLTWKYPNTRAAAILERFCVSETRYTQRLVAILRHPDALVYDAQLVRRLQALHTERGTWRRQWTAQQRQENHAS